MLILLIMLFISLPINLSLLQALNNNNINKNVDNIINNNNTIVIM